jgi:hypothetical protein
MSTKVAKLLSAATVPAVLLALSGCSAEAVNFNNAIAKATKKIEPVGLAFGQTLSPLNQGRDVDGRAIKSAYDQLVQAIEGAQQEVKDLKVPSKPGAQQLHDAALHFLKQQAESLPKFAEVVRVAQDKSMPPAARAGRIQQIFQE